MNRRTEEKVRELLRLKRLLAEIEAKIESLEAEIKEIIEEGD